MKYIKSFYLYENVDIEDNEYKKRLTEEEFLYLLNKHCKNFNPNDRSLIRGDSRLGGGFYYVDGKNRKVDYVNNRMCPIHLEFMSSKYWNGLPKKATSIDFSLEGNTHVSGGFYGKVYRVISYDNAIFVLTDKLVGNSNKILNKDLSVQFLSNVTESLKDFHDNYNEVTYDMTELANNLNELFKDKEKIMGYSGYNKKIILNIYNIINEKGISFREYMEYAFSPNSYNIRDYKEMLKMDKSFGWTDSPVLMIEYNMSKEFFRKYHL